MPSSQRSRVRCPAPPGSSLGLPQESGVSWPRKPSRPARTPDVHRPASPEPAGRRCSPTSAPVGTWGLLGAHPTQGPRAASAPFTGGTEVSCLTQSPTAEAAVGPEQAARLCLLPHSEPQLPVTWSPCRDTVPTQANVLKSDFPGIQRSPFPRSGSRWVGWRPRACRAPLPPSLPRPAVLSAFSSW